MFPMKLIEDYKILEEKDKGKLEKEIAKRLSKGWTILGTVQITSHRGFIHYVQVVIKVGKQ